MNGLSRLAKAYILSTIGVALGLFAFQVPSLVAWQGGAWLFIFLLIGAATAQFFTVVTPKHQHYFLTPTFFFASIMLLGYGPLALVIALAHVPEWLKERYPWYIQSFNIAAHTIAAFAAKALLGWMLPAGMAQLLTFNGAFATLVAGVLYTFLNHLLVGLVLMLARGVSLRESQVFSPANLLTDLALMCLGASIAFLWVVEPWLVIPATAPLILIHRSLSVPTLREEAQVDSKTGLYNAKYFDDILDEELRRARRFGRPLAVVMADLDGLRYVNNTYGHLAGDAVLATVGRIIREQVREYDVASRFGGEEFALLMPETTTHEGYVVAERIRKIVEATPIQVPTQVEPIYITITAGVASFPTDGHEPNALLHAADVALYQGKAAGKNRVRMSSPGDRKGPPEPPAEEAAEPPQEPSPAAPPTPPAPTLTSLITQSIDSIGGRPQVRAGHPPLWRLLTFIGFVTAIGAFLGFVYLPSIRRFDIEGVFILALFAAAAELFSVDLYGAGTVSVSFAAIFAAALMYGPTGAVALAIFIAVAHSVKRRPRGHQILFNAANHAISSTAAALTFALFGVQLRPENLPFLLAPALIAATVNYFLSTLLVSTAIGLSEGTPPWRVWKEQFRWLAVHYIVMGLFALFFGLAYIAFKAWSIVVFGAPLLIIRYAQQQYIAQTVRNVEALRAVNEELARANEEIQMINDELLMTLASAIDARDPYVYGHSRRVAHYAVAIAREMGLPPEQIEIIRRAALLHDVGKIGVSEGVLNKHGQLTEAEFQEMKRHATASGDILGLCHQLQNLVPIVRAHHERWDGQGYPNGLKGEETPLEGRILALADAVEAMASDRAYHTAKSTDEVLAEVQAQAGSQFDPAVAAAFVNVVQKQGPTFIRNSAEEIEQNGTSPWRRERSWPPGELQVGTH